MLIILGKVKFYTKQFASLENLSKGAVIHPSVRGCHMKSINLSKAD